MASKSLVSEQSHSTGPGSETPRVGWRAFGWVVLVLCLAYLPVFFGRIVFFRDIAHWIFPARVFLRESLLSGELPAWNPYQGLGMPVLANPLYGVFYPPNWLTLLVPWGWVGSMLTWLDFAHLVWGAAGICWLARRLGLARTGCVVAAVVWALSGFTTSQWTAGLRLHAGAWIPWAAVAHLALVDSLRRGGRRIPSAIVKAALPTALGLLMGEVFLATMGVLFALAMVAIVRLVERRTDPAPARLDTRWAGAAALAVVLAGGVGAVVIGPARAALAGTDRAAPLTRAEAEKCSLHPLHLIEFAAPGCMGNPYGEYPGARWVGEPALDGLPLSYSVYMGAGALALVLAAFRRRPLALALALAVLVTIALCLALGRHLPVHAVFRRIVLPLSLMRFPEKYTVLMLAGLALLAGLGADRLASGGPQPWRRTLVLLGLLVALGVTAPLVFPFPWSGYMFVGARNGACAVLAVLGVEVLLSRRSRLGPPLLVVVVALDLAAAVWPLQGFAPRALAATVPPAARLVRSERGARPEPPRIYRSEAVNTSVMRWVPASSNAEGEARLLSTLIGNTANAWGIATLPGYDAALPSRLRWAWHLGERDRLKALRLFAADYAVLPVHGALDAPDGRAGVLPLLDPLPGARLFRVEGGLPRVYLAAHAEVLADQAAAQRLFEPDIIAGASAWLAPDAGAQPLAGAPGRAGICRIESFANRHVTARCDADRHALAVFVEQHDPGWRARVDGQPVAVLRANLNMRAIALTPGSHRIELRYHPAGVGLGAGVTLASLLALLGLAVAGRRGARS